MEQILKKIRNFFKQYKEERKEENRRNYYTMKQNEFELAEQFGKMYIVCNNTAIYEAQPDETSADVLAKLEQFRSTAISYGWMKCKK